MEYFKHSVDFMRYEQSARQIFLNAVQRTEAAKKAPNLKILKMLDTYIMTTAATNPNQKKLAMQTNLRAAELLGFTLDSAITMDEYSAVISLALLLLDEVGQSDL